MKKRITITLSPEAIAILKKNKENSGVPVATQIERLVLKSGQK
jgi:hypothetical protein